MDLNERIARRFQLVREWRDVMRAFYLALGTGVVCILTACVTLVWVCATLFDSRPSVISALFWTSVLGTYAAHRLLGRYDRRLDELHAALIELERQ